MGQLVRFADGEGRLQQVIWYRGRGESGSPLKHKLRPSKLKLLCDEVLKVI